MKALVAVVTLVATVALASCTPAPAAPKHQPFGVPKSAAWANGNWVDCWRDEKDEHTFACDIYTADAKLDAKGKFTLVDATGTKSAQPRAPMQYTSWDGAAVHLEGGRRLVRAP